MAQLDFPATPSNGQQFTSGGTIWTWDGAKWVAGATTSAFAPVNSPVFTGDPQAPQPAAGDADASIATTKFVSDAVATSLHDVGRNYLHNSMMNVQQRGTGGWSANMNYTADRWRIGVSSDAVTVNLIPASDAVRTAVGDEAATTYWQNVFTGNAAAGAYNALVQSIEGVRRLAGKTVTLSFWASASSALKLGINYTISYGSGGASGAIWANPTGQSVTLSTAWTRYSVTTTLPTSALKTLGTNGDDRTELWLAFSSGANSNTVLGNIGVQGTPGTVQLWGVQLELGTVATPLEKLDPVTQLQQCQRFYQVGFVSSTSYGQAGSNYGGAGTYSPSMRASPVMAISAPSYTNCGTATIPFNTGAQYIFNAVTTATGFVALSFNWTASADL
jgi:hypothetical protein